MQQAVLETRGGREDIYMNACRVVIEAATTAL